MSYRLTYLFLIEYFRTHKVKTIFSLLGIILSVALFVTTTFNGERAEKTLVDFSLGYFGDKFHAKIKNQNDRIGITDELIEKIFYNKDLRFIDSIHPRIQKSVLISDGNETISVVYQGIDFIKEASDFQDLIGNCSDSKCEKKNSNTFISQALFLKMGSRSFDFLFEGKKYSVKDAEVLNSEGGIFILEDLSYAKERFGLANYSFLLLVISNNETKNLITFKSFLSEIDNSIIIETVEEIKARAANVLKSFHLNLIIISMISVLIAFFMVSNTMSGIFINRKRELGILRCRARAGTIRAAFLAEAALLSVAGALAGFALGHVGAWGVRLAFPQLPAWPPDWAVIAALATALGTGVLFGVLPARRAARLDPVQALSKR
jgi:putative ABC transport system permease protein